MVLCPDLPRRGFSFDNCKRNLVLEEKGIKNKVTKTGTTIVGVRFKDFVILGADTRATAGSIVADKCCMKLHHMSKKIYCAGAGTAADCNSVSRMIEAQIALLELNGAREAKVKAVTRIIKQYLYRYQGHIGCALIIGGVDSSGTHLFSVAPHGSVDGAPFLTMGSGSLAAVAVLESNWKPDLDMDAAKKLVRDAVAAGILNDMGSGGAVNLVAITSKGAQIFNPYEVICEKGERKGTYEMAVGTTPILKTKVIPFEIEKEEVKTLSAEEEPMDI